MATDSRHAGVLPAVFLLSAAAIADQIFLIRLLSFRFWPHFVPLIISQAMLGFGASGVALHLLRSRVARLPERVFAWTILLAAPSFDLAFRFSQLVPFDPSLLLWELSSWPAFALFFSVLSVPFFLAGTAVGIPLSFRLGKAGPVYASSFLGSAAGAVLALPAFHLFPTESLLRVPLGLGVASAAFVLAYPDGRLRAGRVLAAGLCAFLLALPPDPLVSSPYKDLAVFGKLPGGKILSVRSGPEGDFRALFAPGIHNAPGLSYRFEGEIPPQAAVFADGELRGVVPEKGGKRVPDYLGYFPAALPYRLSDRPAVAQFGMRGTEGILSAAGNGASSVTVVEPAAEYVRMIEGDLDGFSGGFPAFLQVEVVNEGARNHLARTKRFYDLLELADVSSPTYSSLGIHAAGETFLLTREGIRAALSRITGSGMLSVSGWLKSPPRESVKILNTVRAELERGGFVPVSNRVIVVRGWGSFVAVVRKHPFTEEEREKARRFCDERGFSMVWPEGEKEHPSVQRDVGDRAFRDAVRAILADPPAANREGGLFDLRPVTDDSPYFHRFLPLRSLPEFRRLLGDQWVPFLEWGVVFLVVSLVVSVALAAVFLLVPLLTAESRGKDVELSMASYFCALGLAYLLVELTFLKIGILVLGDTIRAATAAVGGFLLFSGIGSAVSGKWETPGTMTRFVFPGIVVLSLAGFLALFHGTPFLLAEGKIWQAGVFVASLAPAAFLMGIPFPAALSRMSQAGSTAIPFAWGVNGFFSVAGASLASVGALWIGFRGTLFAGALLYLLAGALYPRLGTRPSLPGG